METKTQWQGLHTKTQLTDDLSTWVESFLFDRKSQNMAAGTLTYYQVKLRTLLSFCESRQISRMDQLTADELRRFMAQMEECGHNAGGRLALFRAIKTFLLWYE